MLYIRDLGLSDYREIWEMQKELQQSVIAQKGNPQGDEYLLLTEHRPVYTLGRHGKPENMLLNATTLADRHVELVRIERGGDITFHGPGQLVAYPIISLQRHGLGVKSYVSLLEESVIRTIADYGIEGERIEGATGVWIGKGTLRERKICAIGVKCSKFVTMHGLALNVNTDLDYFNAINPCGFIDKGVTSISMETGGKVDFKETEKIFSRHFADLLASGGK